MHRHPLGGRTGVLRVLNAGPHEGLPVPGGVTPWGCPVCGVPVPGGAESRGSLSPHSPLPALRRRAQLRAAIEAFRQRRDLEAAWRTLSGAWAPAFFRQRRPVQRAALKNHVRGSGREVSGSPWGFGMHRGVPIGRFAGSLWGGGSFWGLPGGSLWGL